ncbi:hypothetical protein DS957_028515 [Vibrio harveyi]|uniref:Uncharacterized protein n=1 Tax=Vibrio harveyi TaxID=669 RepID=A0A8B3DBB4_VIBHA|nr:hypothetical protein DS957_028515 [Vibrio harveyi]
MGRESGSIGCLVLSLSVKEDSNNGQGANTFGTSTDLDRLLSLFPSKSTKIKKPTKSRTLAMGFGFCYSFIPTCCILLKNNFIYMLKGND